MTIGGIIDTLCLIKDRYRSSLSMGEIDTINDACNILDYCLTRFRTVDNILASHVTSIHWTEEDIQHALAEDGFEPDMDNVSTVLNYPGLAKYLQERGIEAGWDVIHSVISDCKPSLLVLQSDSNQSTKEDDAT